MPKVNSWQKYLAFLALGYFCLLGLPAARQSTAVFFSLLGFGILFLVWTGILCLVPGNGRLSPKVLWEIKGNHYIQLAAQGILLVAFSWHYPGFAAQLPFFGMQLFFAYFLEALLRVTLGRPPSIGFGPFPIVISLNLFIWFRPEYFYAQLFMVALALIIKYTLTWERGGVRRHIFNPSSAALFLISLFLIFSGGTVHLTQAIDVSTKIYPDSAYLILFVSGLLVQFFFHVTLMTLFGVGALVFLGAVAYQITGTYWFIDSHIPPAVFLGLHLLITDPRTAPESKMGRALFGIAYGVSIFISFGVLYQNEIPTLYDKILWVPLLNLTVPLFDRAGYGLSRWALGLKWISPGIISLVSRNGFHMCLWVVLFGSLLGIGYFSPQHPGRSFSYWEGKCIGGVSEACEILARLKSLDCRNGNAGVCNGLGAQLEMGNLFSGIRYELQVPEFYYQKACDLGDPEGCLNFLNLLVFKNGKTSDGQAALAALKSVAAECKKGHGNSCYVAGFGFLKGVGVKPSASKGYFLLARGCELNQAAACSKIGHMHLTGEGAQRDPARAEKFLSQACQAGHKPSCGAVTELFPQKSFP